MLSPGLVSTYQQYKLDTTVIASWLAATAKQLGYDGQLGKPTGESVPSWRLKGKARKQAKQKQAAMSAMKSGSGLCPIPEAKHVLAVRDFVPLAQFISSKLETAPWPAETKVEIPLRVKKSLERTIRARKASVLHFGETQPHLDDGPNKTHAHFVVVLEKVHDLLFKAQAEVTAINTDYITTESDRDDTEEMASGRKASVFSLLQAYEPSEEFLNAPDVASTIHEVQEFEFVAEEEDARSECIFAFMALMQDFERLREKIFDLWEAYQNGEMDLAAAAVGVNLALELAKTMEEDISPLLKKHGGTMVLIPTLYTAACSALDLDPDYRTRPSDEMNFSCYEVGASLLFNVACLLQAIRKGLPYGSKEVPRYTGKFGYFDPQSAGLDIRPDQRWAYDKAAIMEVIPDICTLSMMRGLAVQDEFARGIEAMFHMDEIPIWLCFATQNYLDTLRFFGPNITKPHAEFRRFNDSSVKLLETVMAADPSNALCKDLEKMRDTSKVRHGMDIFTALLSSRDTTSRQSPFLLHNPLFCGLWIHHRRVTLHTTGIRYAAKPGVMLHAVQLYEAARQHQQKYNAAAELDWPDLDRLIAIQGTQAFFVGAELPSSPEAHFKNYCLSRCISPTNWLNATKRRKGKHGTVNVQMSKAGMRDLLFQGPASRWTEARAMNPQRLNAELVHQVLEASGWLKTQQKLRATESGTSSVDGRKPGAANGRAKASDAGTRPALTMPELVHHVAHAVQNEIPTIEFNYFAIHEAADSLLRRLRANADGLGLENEPRITKNIVDVVGYIFSIAAAEMSPLSANSVSVLSGVAKEMQDFLTKRTGLGTTGLV